MIHFARFKFSTHPDLAKIASAIRNEVFIQEQYVDPALEHDAFDYTADHYLLYLENTPVATARWRYTENGIKLERFAVLKTYRGKGFGDLLLKEVLADVLPLNRPIYLHAQTQVIKYYKKHGFKKKGRPFYEANIEHYLMELK